MDAWVIWTVIGIALIIVEMVSMVFVASYFGIGALATAVVAAAGGGHFAQYTTFAIVSIILLLLTRPLLMKSLKMPKVESNVHSMTGKSAIVTKAIDNDSNTGQVRVGTEYWTARSTDDSKCFSVDEKVKIVNVDGVTARVEALSD